VTQREGPTSLGANPEKRTGEGGDLSRERGTDGFAEKIREWWLCSNIKSGDGEERGLRDPPVPHPSYGFDLLELYVARKDTLARLANCLYDVLLMLLSLASLSLVCLARSKEIGYVLCRAAQLKAHGELLGESLLVDLIERVAGQVDAGRVALISSRPVK
jgi:hypothetical protein